jgi:hypothetical protein
MSSTDKVTTSKTDDENAEPVANKQQTSSSNNAADSSSTNKPSSSSSDESTVVCRFRISQLRVPGSSAYAKNDYFVDLVKSQHGLLDLVTSVFVILQQREKLTSDQFYSHLWYMKFNNIKYAYGWRTTNGTSSGGDVTVSNHLDEQEPRLLNALPFLLEKGQKGSFHGESANFDMVVEDAALETLLDAAQAASSYPKITAIPNTMSSKLESDFIPSDDQTKQECHSLAQKWLAYYQGNNEWRRDRDTCEWVLRQPIRPAWGAEECQIMGLLLNSGCKFKKSWTNVLRYAFLDRSEGATSGEWYKLQKESYRRDHIGRSLPSKEERILLAKRLAKARMLKLLQAGVPDGPPPHPHERTEKVLRKRGMITDDMDEVTKKMKLRMYHGDVDMLDSDYESDDDGVRIY